MELVVDVAQMVLWVDAGRAHPRSHMDIGFGTGEEGGTRLNHGIWESAQA